VKKNISEWGDDLCVIVLYPDPRAERLQHRLEQLQRVEDWLRRLSRASSGSCRCHSHFSRDASWFG
jgi:hypothetical protein